MQSTSSAQNTFAQLLPPRGSSRHSSVAEHARSSHVLSTQLTPLADVSQRCPGPQPSAAQGLAGCRLTFPSVAPAPSPIGKEPVSAPAPGRPLPTPDVVAPPEPALAKPGSAAPLAA